VLARLGRDAESAKELERPCHRGTGTRLAASRSRLLAGLGLKEQAAAVRGSGPDAVPPGKVPHDPK
jgi:hypothetical protein